MTFQPDTALAYARSLARPRRVGTPEEVAIIGEIAARLEQFGYRVERQAFEFSMGAHVATTLVIFGALVLIVLTFWAWSFSALAGVAPALLLLGLLAGASRINRLVAEASVAAPTGLKVSAWQRLCLRLGARHRTANIVARLPPTAEAAAGPGQPPRLLLVAHWDSKSQALPLAGRMGLIAVAGGSAIAFAVLDLLRPIAAGLTSAAALAGLLAMVAGVPVLLLFLAGAGNASPGAIDNASGAGLVLHLAEVLAQARPSLPFGVLITGAEELGVMGATAFVQSGQRAGTLPPAGAGQYVLNFDGIGTKGRLAVVGNAMGALGSLVRECCVDLRLPLGRLPLVGAQFDHIPFAEHGYEALSLVTLGPAARRVHTPADDVDQLDAEGFRQAGEVALRLIRKLDQT